MPCKQVTIHGPKKSSGGGGGGGGGGSSRFGGINISGEDVAIAAVGLGAAGIVISQLGKGGK